MAGSHQDIRGQPNENLPGRMSTKSGVDRDWSGRSTRKQGFKLPCQSSPSFGAGASEMSGKMDPRTPVLKCLQEMFFLSFFNLVYDTHMSHRCLATLERISSQTKWPKPQPSCEPRPMFVWGVEKQTQLDNMSLVIFLPQALTVLGHLTPEDFAKLWLNTG